MTESNFCYFLVTHGSRNPSAVEFLQNIVNLAQAKSLSLVGGGLLEGQELSLSQQLSNFGKIARSHGYSQVLVLPVFLLAGIHVYADIPEQIAIAQTDLSDLEIKIAPHFGTYPEITPLLKSKFLFKSQERSPAKILLAHGSRRLETTHYLENLAQDLKAIPAYWAIAPNLETQIEHLIKLGQTEMTILPYFLATGGIIEAVESKISQYSQYSTQINLLELPFTPEAIATLVIKFAREFTENYLN